MVRTSFSQVDGETPYELMQIKFVYWDSFSHIIIKKIKTLFFGCSDKHILTNAYSRVFFNSTHLTQRFCRLLIPSLRWFSSRSSKQSLNAWTASTLHTKFYPDRKVLSFGNRWKYGNAKVRCGTSSKGISVNFCLATRLEWTLCFRGGMTPLFRPFQDVSPLSLPEVYRQSINRIPFASQKLMQPISPFLEPVFFVQSIVLTIVSFPAYSDESKFRLLLQKATTKNRWILLEQALLRSFLCAIYYAK